MDRSAIYNILLDNIRVAREVFKYGLLYCDSDDIKDLQKIEILTGGFIEDLEIKKEFYEKKETADRVKQLLNTLNIDVKSE